MDRPLCVTVIGGGTGTRTVLQALRDETRFDLTAVVSMADNGGSSGKLRKELGVLPPGDLRQCLLALSMLPPELKAVLEYRFAKGTINGHPIGNLLIAAAQEYCNNMEEALCLMKLLLQVRGNVVPVTTTPTHLCIEHGGTVTTGEIEIVHTTLAEPRRCSLTGDPHVGRSALQAINRADVIIIGPGNLYASVLPNFLVRGVRNAICTAPARFVYLANLVTSPGHTDGWDAAKYLATIEEYSERYMDIVVVNDRELSPELLAHAPAGAAPVVIGTLREDQRVLCADLVDPTPLQQQKGDIIERNHLRHDPTKLRTLLTRLLFPS